VHWEVHCTHFLKKNLLLNDVIWNNRPLCRNFWKFHIKYCLYCSSTWLVFTERFHHYFLLEIVEFESLQHIAQNVKITGMFSNQAHQGEYRNEMWSLKKCVFAITTSIPIEVISDYSQGRPFHQARPRRPPRAQPSKGAESACFLVSMPQFVLVWCVMCAFIVKLV